MQCDGRRHGDTCGLHSQDTRSQADRHGSGLGQPSDFIIRPSTFGPDQGQKGRVAGRISGSASTRGWASVRATAINARSYSPTPRAADSTD